jgi:hypothetical protein
MAPLPSFKSKLSPHSRKVPAPCQEAGLLTVGQFFLEKTQISQRGRAATELLSRERNPEPERRRLNTDFTD